MPSIGQRGNGSGRSRRLVNDINVVPYIDVMLVLLVIFMVTAPMMPPGVIDLPRAGKSNTRPDAYIELEVRASGELRLKSVNNADSQERRVARRELSDALQQLRAGSDIPVVVSGDKSVRYETIVEVMDELYRLNVPRVALMVKPSGN
ncbi:MAG: ExbD/TolR family protein [Quisquiliibacterium sp.]|jgi:biopolymer transport protein TolR